MEKLIECRICGKGNKRLDVHVTKGHKTTMDEYYKLYPEEKDNPTMITVDEDEDYFSGNEIKDIPIPDVVEKPKAKITPQEIRDGIYKKDITMVDEPLSEFLKEFELTERELRQIVRQYKTGSAMTALEAIEREAEFGKVEAIKLAGQGKVETTNLQAAETLKKQHGYTVAEVKSGPPQTWVLIKK